MCAMTSMGDLDKARRRKDLKETLARVGRKYLVMSGKGGVGKSTVAVSVAAALAARGARVGLLDIDLHGPSVATALRLTESIQCDESGKLRPVVSENGLKIVSIQGLLARPDEALIWRGPKKVRAIEQFFSEAVWGDLDYLIVDSPPGTGDEPLTALQTVPDLRPLMITSGHRLAISDVAKAFSFLQTMGRPAFGLVDNQSWWLCPRCGEVTDIYDRQAAAKLARRENVPLLASLPMDLAAARSTEEGRPLVWSAPEHPFSQRIFELAGQL